MTSVNDAAQADLKAQLELEKKQAITQFKLSESGLSVLVFVLSMIAGYSLAALIPVSNEEHKLVFVFVGGILPGFIFWLIASKLDDWRMTAFKKGIVAELSTPKEESTPEDQ